MSMIMQIARGAMADLERFAEQDDDSAVSGEIEAAFARRHRMYQRLGPESRAQLEAIIRADPRLQALAPQLIARLRGEEVGLQIVETSAADAEQESAPSAGPEILDLHKSWHILHYLFTGEAAEGGAPGNFLFGGGREIGEDRGYGPGHLLDAAETAAVARFLAPLSVAELTRRIDGPRMAQSGIYCADDGGRAAVREMADDVAHYFPQLQAHVQAAADAGQALFVWLS